MNLTSITLTNFKGITTPTKIPLKPITLLFGANSAGKSTILQALLYFRGLLESQDPNRSHLDMGGKIVDLGDFKNLVNGHDNEKSIEIQLSFKANHDGLYSYDNPVRTLPENHPLIDFCNAVETIDLGLLIKWNKQSNRAIISEYQVNLNGKRLAHIEEHGAAYGIFHSIINADHDLLELVPEYIKTQHFDLNPIADEETHDYTDIEQEQALPPINQSLNLIYYDDRHLEHDYLVDPKKNLEQQVGSLAEQIGHFHAFMNQLYLAPAKMALNELNRLCYIGPLRDLPPRYFDGRQVDSNVCWANGLEAWRILYQGKLDDHSEFVNEVSKSLSSEGKLNLGYKVEYNEVVEIDRNSPLYKNIVKFSELADSLDDDYYQLNIVDLLINHEPRRFLEIYDQAGMKVAFQDIGIGISQLLPIVVAVKLDRHSIVAVEQPELHVHPAIQCCLGDVFIEELSSSSDKTFLLETHSEHLLLRLLKRIRETSSNTLPPDKFPLSPDDLAIIYVENSDDGVKLTNITVDADGEFNEEWPKGFFEERMGEWV